MADVLERVTKIVVDRLGVEETEVVPDCKLQRRFRRRLPRCSRTCNAIRR